MADSSNTTTPAPSAPTPTPTTTSITTNISKPATPRSRESSESAGSDGGRPRGYIATRFFRPSLVDLCIPVMAANFLCFPTFGYISLDLRPKVVTLLPLDLPLDLAAYLIYEDEYWERRSRLHWSNSDIAAHGRSWKQLFFERYFSDALESFDPTCSEESALTNMLHICAQYIHNLIIYQLPSRLNISVFLVPLASQIETLKIEYGSRNVGMEYDKLRFGMKTSDCRSMSAALRVSLALSELTLSYNLIDDKKVEILVNGMAANPTIVHLDLSHNYISDAGVIEIMKLMSADKSVLTVLNLCNNCITTQGAINITETLKTNSVLLYINLRHNSILDEGGQVIFEALYVNSSLEVQLLLRFKPVVAIIVPEIEPFQLSIGRIICSGPYQTSTQSKVWTKWS
ncbi:hypothetical protein SELMODRAFT_432339 [Selaginella moellendorffii]|uniref:Uncharacterized protein n=1 Tax=Selaginella moellendorffii TaxID=88036 RepID=D8TFP9_SELML|nr:hypothetical protein SELMODRAFT_432339 [Selaginella moellendorffii]